MIPRSTIFVISSALLTSFTARSADPIPFDWKCPGEKAERNILLFDQLPCTHDQTIHKICYANATAKIVSAAVSRKTHQSPVDISPEWLACSQKPTVSPESAKLYLEGKSNSIFNIGDGYRNTIDSMLSSNVCADYTVFKPLWTDLLGNAEAVRRNYSNPATSPLSPAQTNQLAHTEEALQSAVLSLDKAYREQREKLLSEPEAIHSFDLSPYRRIPLKNPASAHFFKFQEAIAKLDTLEAYTKKKSAASLCDPNDENVQKLARILLNSACAGYPLITSFLLNGIPHLEERQEVATFFNPDDRTGAHGAVLVGILHKEDVHGFIFSNSWSEGSSGTPHTSFMGIELEDLCRVGDIDAVLDRDEPLIWKPDEVDDDFVKKYPDAKFRQKPLAPGALK